MWKGHRELCGKTKVLIRKERVEVGQDQTNQYGIIHICVLQQYLFWRACVILKDKETKGKELGNRRLSYSKSFLKSIDVLSSPLNRDRCWWWLLLRNCVSHWPFFERSKGIWKEPMLWWLLSLLDNEIHIQTWTVLLLNQSQNHLLKTDKSS